MLGSGTFSRSAPAQRTVLEHARPLHLGAIPPLRAGVGGKNGALYIDPCSGLKNVCGFVVLRLTKFFPKSSRVVATRVVDDVNRKVIGNAALVTLLRRRDLPSCLVLRFDGVPNS